MAKLGEFELNHIYTGDARELTRGIPDESVDLIFTDPIYDNQDDYKWLAHITKRTLRPGGALLVWSNGKWHRENANWLESFGLTYRYDFANLLIRAMAPMNGMIISKCNRVLWFDVCGESRLSDYVADGYAEPCDRTLGKSNWSKSPKFTRYLLEAFTAQIVLDPFSGGGTVPYVCEQLQKDWIAFEIDQEKAREARSRVIHHQIMLPLSRLSDSTRQLDLGLSGEDTPAAQAGSFSLNPPQPHKQGD